MSGSWGSGKEITHRLTVGSQSHVVFFFFSWYKTCKKPVAEVSYKQCFKEETRRKNGQRKGNLVCKRIYGHLMLR